MRINNINSINFKGMWAPVKVSKKETGAYHLNKRLVTLYDLEYHPWDDETKEETQREVDKYFWGRFYSVMDIGCEDTHFKCNVYEMNRVRVGDKIRHEDKEKLLKQGYTDEVVIAVPSDDEFKELYPNASYAACDVFKIDNERIDELANEHFSED